MYDKFLTLLIDVLCTDNGITIQNKIKFQLQITFHDTKTQLRNQNKA